MRIKYITNVRLPTSRAAGYAIMKMCSEFAKAGADVSLFVPERKNNENKQDPFDFYKIEKNFEIKKIPSLDFLALTENFGRIFYWFDTLSFLIATKLKVKLSEKDILYTRDFLTTLFFSKRKFKVLELHSISKSKFLFSLAVKRTNLFVVLTTSIKKTLIDFGVDDKKILISPSGVDLSQFNQISDNFEIKGISKGDFVYGYVGTLKTMGMEKGVADGLRVLNLLPANFKFLVIGGEVEDVEYYKKMSVEFGVSDRVVFIGNVPHADVNKYSMKCDVFVAPFPENKHYSYYMSPLKIFEYMASKKPIITTTLPTLTEILTNEENAILVPPSSPWALASAIKRLSEDRTLCARLVENAYSEVKEKYTWEIRTQRILQFVDKK